MTFVKICGLTDMVNVRLTAEAGADWAGFVLSAGSPRNLLGHGHSALDVAAELVDLARGFELAAVILLTDPDEALFQAVVSHIGPDAIQLHGRETLAQVMRLARSVPPEMELWKAFAISGPEDLDALEDWPLRDGPLNRILLDAKPPEGSRQAGGHGQAFDWNLLADWEAPLPWLLAGGLRPDTVAEAIAITGAPAVDVSSGVERAPGLKDSELIAAFIDAAKSV